MFAKKTGPSYIQTQEFCRPKRVLYLQAERAEDTKKLKTIMDQGMTSPVYKVVHGKKILVPDCITLANRRGNNPCLG